jgi:ubiquitin conjugation factor E4 B
MVRHHQNAINAVEKAIALKYSIEGVVLDEGMQTTSLTFMRYVSVFLLRTASGSDYVPGKKFALPLAIEKPESFSCLPEYALHDVVDNFKFVFRYVSILAQPSNPGDGRNPLTCIAASCPKSSYHRLETK